MNQITKSFLLKTLKFIFFWIIVGLLIYTIGKYIHLFLPFIIAFIFSAIINPLKKFLVYKFHFPSGIAILTAMILELGSLTLIITLIVLRFIKEIHDIYLHWPLFVHQFQHTFSHWLLTIETVYLKLPNYYINSINDVINGIINSLPNLLPFGVSVAVSIPEFIIIIVIAFVATYFMSKNSKRYITDFVRIFPREWRESLIELGRDFSNAFAGFIKAEVIIYIITTAFSIFGLLIFHAKYAIIIGIITGVFGILPVLGVGIILVPWALFSFLTGQTIFSIELILLTAVISIMRHIIEPKILGDNVGLDPLFVLISMYIGLASTGAIGLILGPFIIIAFKALQKAGVFRNL